MPWADFFPAMKTRKKGVPTTADNERCPDGMSAADWQRSLRERAAAKGMFAIQPLPAHWSTGAFSVTNPRSKRHYTAIYHAPCHPYNTCSCMDFRTNSLGTCKHLEAVRLWLGNKGLPATLPLPRRSVLDVCYSKGRRVRLRIAPNAPEALTISALRYFDDDACVTPGMLAELPAFIETARKADPSFHCTTDALNLILEERDRRRREDIERKLTDDDIGTVIKTDLYPYQTEGIRFAFRAGRTLIADEMGLGKTVQAIGVARLLMAQNMVGSVLVVCPTSLKYQWKKEIERFTDNDVVVIEGIHTHRRDLYNADASFKIVSYHTLANDIRAIGTIAADMVIMDEVQRLKNWNTQIAQAARRIEADYTVVLSGTPLENKIEELYSVMQFVDQYALAPYHEFLSDTRVSEPGGKVTGYRNLNAVGARLKNCMLRRRKKDVALQLPPRTDKILYVPMTKEQRAIHDEAMTIVAQLVAKWQKHRFLSEKDRKRLLLLLSRMRMVCDSTYLIDLSSRFDTKIAETVQQIIALTENGNDKAVVFSQWERMTSLIAAELDRAGIGYVYLHGSIPAAKRGAVCDEFTSDPAKRVFLSTDAGSVGLNLQCASTVINLDLPWNPAVLEQRIARADRIGRNGNLQVINLVAAGTIEEKMLGTLDFKSNLFEGILDGGNDTVTLDDSRLSRIAESIARIIGPATDTADEITGTLIAETEMPIEALPDDSDSRPEHSRTPEPAELICAARSFFSSLAATLGSPEATARLIDTIVHTDPETSRTELRIPVNSKESVARILSGFAALLTNSSHNSSDNPK